MYTISEHMNKCYRASLSLRRSTAEYDMCLGTYLRLCGLSVDSVEFRSWDFIPPVLVIYPYVLAPYIDELRVDFSKI